MLTHVEFLYLLSRAELIERQEKKHAEKGTEFFGSRAYVDMEDGSGAFVRVEGDQATLFLRLPIAASPEQGLLTAKQFFGDTFTQIRADWRDDRQLHMAFEGPRPKNPIPTKKPA